MVIGGLGALLRGGAVAGLVGVAVAVVVVALAWRRSDTVALRAAGARPADQAQYPRLHNLVEGLCVAGGLPKPALLVVEDGCPNAFAVGLDPKRASLVVTTGLLEALDLVELEGIIAHELSHVKNLDIRVSTLAVTLVARPARLLPEATADRIVEAVVGRQREVAADVHGVSITRYPPGLISALEKLRADTSVIHSTSRATAHLWIETPHPPLDERIEALREL